MNPARCESQPPVNEARSDTGYFPNGNRTRDFIRNASCRFEIRHTADRQSYVVSIPEENRPLIPTTYFGSTAALLLDYGFSSAPLFHKALTEETPSHMGNLFRRIGSRPRRSIGLFNEPFSNVRLPENFLSILEEILPQYRDVYPDHPLLIRGLIRGQHEQSFRRIRQLGFTLIPYRRIFIFQPGPEKSHLPQIKRDLSELRKRRKLISRPTEPLPAEDYENLARLYHGVYLVKYSSLNPDYTAAFISHMHSQGHLNLIVCRTPSGVPAGFLAYTRQGHRIISNLVGQDRQKMPNISPYFLTLAAAFELALQERCLINFGAGGQKFKTTRGYIPDYEFLAVYIPRGSLWRAARDFGRSFWK